MKRGEIIQSLFALLFAPVALSVAVHAGEKQGSGVPNLSDRPQQQDRNVDIFADVLYWKATETVDWALVIAEEEDVERVSFKTLSFPWDPGFRVGFGYNMKHDQWDTQFYYTRFRTKTSQRAEGGDVASAFLGTKVSDVGTYTTGKISLNLNFNMFDWELGRAFFVSKDLSLRPFIGIKGGWINQMIHTHWQNPNFFFDLFPLSASESLKNDFRGGGPRGGVNTKWILGNVSRCYFSIFGDFSASYMWGHWDVKDQFEDNFQDVVFVKVGNRNFGSFVLQGLMGFKWEFNFDRESSHLAFKLGYEVQDWLDQYQVFDNLTGGHDNDLILQGLTFDVRFDF